LPTFYSLKILKQSISKHGKKQKKSIKSHITGIKKSNINKMHNIFIKPKNLSQHTI